MKLLSKEGYQEGRQITSKSILFKYLTPSDEIIFMNENSNTTLILTKKQLLIHGHNQYKSKGFFAHEYVIALESVTAMHISGKLIKSITINTQGTTYTFILGQVYGRDQFGNKNQFRGRSLVEHVIKLTLNQQELLRQSFINQRGRDTLYCRYCGKQIDFDSEFCKFCGKSQK